MGYIKGKEKLERKKKKREERKKREKRCEDGETRLSRNIRSYSSEES